MVLPRIYDNILNHSYFDLQSNPIKTIVCLANGYPIPDVFWIRGFFIFNVCTLFLSIQYLAQFRIG